MKTKFPKDNSRHAGMNPTEKAEKKYYDPQAIYY